MGLKMSISFAFTLKRGSHGVAVKEFDLQPKGHRLNSQHRHPNILPCDLSALSMVPSPHTAAPRAPLSWLPLAHMCDVLNAEVEFRCAHCMLLCALWSQWPMGMTFTFSQNVHHVAGDAAIGLGVTRFFFSICVEKLTSGFHLNFGVWFVIAFMIL